MHGVDDFVAEDANDFHRAQSSSKGEWQGICYESILGHRISQISMRRGIGFASRGPRLVPLGTPLDST
jgi:hypothetical protein